MKPRLLEFLRCPACLAAVELEVFSGTDDVEEGRLACGGCARIFPVINGIPRMLPDQFAHLVPRYHVEFFRRYGRSMAPYLDRCQTRPGDKWWRAERRTLASYSYQWRKFKEMLPHWEEVFRECTAPIAPDFFPGKIGLDAGCGFGRSLYYAASYGAEMIGMDLSEAVEAARENTRHLADVHLVQGDIFHPPFAGRSLEFVYSIGVLHHLPDPKRGFLHLTGLVKPGAPVFIWVYPRGRGRQIAVFDLMRAVSTRLPFRLLDLLCLVLAAGQWVAWIAPYRFLSRFGPTRRLIRRLPDAVHIWHIGYPFRVLHANWFDGLSVPLVNYYRRDEIAGWFREAGFNRIETGADWGKGGGGRALGYAPMTVSATLTR